MRITGFLMVALLAFAAPASAEAVKHGDLLIGDARVRMVHGKAPSTAAYATITNTGDSDDRLVAVATDIAGRSEIHTMTVDGGVMRMRELPDGIPIPAGETVALEPGGLHLMLMRLKSRPGAGGQVVLRLEFERAGAVEVKAPVKRIHHGH